LLQVSRPVHGNQQAPGSFAVREPLFFLGTATPANQAFRLTTAAIASSGFNVSSGTADPLLFHERKAYLGAVQDALAGVEAARVVLAGVVRRIEGR
jgi:hypothetical protein